MNLLMLSDVYFPRVNGVSTSIRTYAQSLSELGHRVTIVAPEYGKDSGEDKYGASGAYEIIRLPARAIFFDAEDRLILASALRAVLPQLALRQWDVIHIHTPFRAHQLGIRLARLTGRPTVETFHTYFEEYIANYVPWAPKPLLRMLARRVMRKTCNDVGHLIVPSQQIAEVLGSYGIIKPHTVLPTGIDLREFTGGSGAAFRKLHSIPADRLTLVTVGRLAIEKNIEFLLQVVQRLTQDFPGLLLLIAGEGPDASRLKQLSISMGLKDNVCFVGNLDRRTTLLDCYRAGDIFVFASPTETQGLVLIEAMALAVPIVSTAVMGTADVLREAHSACVSEEKVDVFSAHVARLLRSTDERAKLSSAGPIDAKAWSTDVLMRRAVALYGELAKGASLEKGPSSGLRNTQ